MKAAQMRVIATPGLTEWVRFRQRQADQLQREARQAQREADAGRKELKRRKKQAKGAL